MLLYCLYHWSSLQSHSYNLSALPLLQFYLSLPSSKRSPCTRHPGRRLGSFHFLFFYVFRSPAPSAVPARSSSTVLPFSCCRTVSGTLSLPCASPSTGCHIAGYHTRSICPCPYASAMPQQCLQQLFVVFFVHLMAVLFSMPCL